MATEIIIVNPNGFGSLYRDVSSYTEQELDYFKRKNYHHTMQHINMPHSQELIINRFNTYEGDFNIVIYNHPNHPNKTNPSNFPEGYRKYLKKNCTNLFYISNVGDNTLPFTPWIATHRIAHMVQSEHLIQHDLPIYMKWGHDLTTEKISELHEKLYNFKEYHWALTSGTDFYCTWKKYNGESGYYIESYVMPCKSGRNNQIKNRIDFMAEIFTYFMYNKCVKFNRLKHEDFVVFKEEKKFEAAINEINDLLSYYEEAITNEMNCLRKAIDKTNLYI